MENVAKLLTRRCGSEGGQGQREYRYHQNVETTIIDDVSKRDAGNHQISKNNNKKTTLRISVYEIKNHTKGPIIKSKPPSIVFWLK